MRNCIMLAHDNTTFAQAAQLADATAGHVKGHKANDLLYCEEGAPAVIRKFNENGGIAFADVKLHDIPTTVENTVRKLALAGASLITAHCSGGRKMLRAAVVTFIANCQRTVSAFSV